MSKFFCDSNCELWWSRAKELDINLIKMPYTVNGKEYAYDLGENTSHKEFFDKLKNGETPATQALNPQNYIDYFEPVLSSGEDILYVHFSHNMSGTFEYMKIAIAELKEKYPDRTIKYVDNLSISMGAGLIVYEAAKMHKAGKSDDEIIKWVEYNRQNFACCFVVEDLNFLKRGGRISGTAAMFGSMLSIKPILKVSDEGRIVPVSKAMGKKKAILDLVNIVKENGENLADYPICILEANAKEDANFLKEKIREYVGADAEIWVQPVGPTIGCHCGPGTVGIAFRCKKI